jgi:hypothetical protein
VETFRGVEGPPTGQQSLENNSARFWIALGFIDWHHSRFLVLFVVDCVST